MGILYFIQPAELVGTNRYKIGCSSKSDLSRLRSYRVGTRILMVLECDNPFEVEGKLIEQFNSIFHKVAGNEWFEGNEKDMRTLFYDMYLQYEKRPMMVD
jgi:hypothetical protein